MATNAVVPFDKAQVPAALQGAFGDDTNIEPRVQLPTLSFRGKVFRLIINGEEHVIAKKDEDSGEMIPRSIVEFIVLDHQHRRSRAHFEGSYKEGESQRPVCWSTDGVKPDENVPEEQKQCDTCAACPQAVKGAKTTEDGRKVTACSMFKRLAVTPLAKDFRFGPMLMKLPITSLWDKSNEAQAAEGWYAWDQYGEFLLNRGVKNTAMVVTAAKFDQTPSYPKLLFKAMRYISEPEIPQIQQLRANPLVKQICTGDIAEALETTTEDVQADQSEGGGEIETVPAKAPPTKPAAAPAAPAAPKAPAKPAKARTAPPAKAAEAPPAKPQRAPVVLDEDEVPDAAQQEATGDSDDDGEDIGAMIEGWNS
jgi:hypothetical protein